MGQVDANAVEEIDLVDLAIALWRRKGLILMVALAVTAAATVFAFYRAAQPPLHAYTSLYSLPTVMMRSPSGDGVVDALPTIMPTAELIAIAQSLYVPASEAALGQSDISVDIDSPKGTRLIQLKTTLPAGQDQPDVAKLHKQIIMQMRDEISGRIKALEASDNGSALEGQATVRLVSGGRIVMLAKEKTTETKQPKTGLIITLGGILGLCAGVFVALLAGFWQSVRQRMATPN